MCQSIRYNTVYLTCSKKLRCSQVSPLYGTDRKIKETSNTFCQTRSLSNSTSLFLITWRSSSSKFAAVYKISWKSDDFSLRYGDITIFEMIWRYSYLNFSHIWLEMPVHAPKMGVLEDFGPLNVIIYHRNPKKGLLRESASFKLSTVKIRWAVWPVGELTESMTDTHTHTHTHTGKFIFCPCIALDTGQAKTN